MTAEDKRFCSNCNFNKPAALFKKIKLKRGARYLCGECYEKRKHPRTTEERDAFGKTITERNKSESAKFAKLLNERK